MSTFNTTSTAAGTIVTVSAVSTPSTVSLSDSLDGAGMRPSRYSNTTADSGVVPSPTRTSRPSTSRKTYYDRDPPLFGRPEVPFLDGDMCCDPTVAVPTVEQCMEVISVAPNTTLMHSGGMHSSGALKKVLEEKRDYLEGYTPLSFKHISRDFSQVYASVPRAWSSLSTALATMTSGVVYVLLPEGRGTDDFPPGGHFSLNEWPYLSDDVTHVIRINEKNREREYIYVRPDHVQHQHLTSDHVQHELLIPGHVQHELMTPDHVQRELSRPNHVQHELLRPEHIQREFLRPDHMQYERKPASETLYAKFNVKFGYPLQQCPTPPLDIYKMGISPDGRCFTAEPGFPFGYIPDERSRGRAGLAFSDVRSSLG